MAGRSRAKLRPRGFTLIELLVVVVCIGILCAIAVPNYINNRSKAQMSSVVQNMHAVQLAAQSYSVDTGGNYANDPGQLQPYFPGGGNTPNGNPGTFPTNPMSSAQNESPAKCSISGSTWITEVRSSTSPASFGGTAGQTAYTGINDTGVGNDCFAVTGNGINGTSILGQQGYIVLSNE